MKVSKSHGSPEQLKALVENKIAELGGDLEIESATNTCGIAAKPQTINADAESGDIGYIQRLEEAVVADLEDVLTDASWGADDSSEGGLHLTATCPSIDRILEFTIPYSDLQMDDEDADVRYICDTIRLTIDDPDNYIDIDEDVESATDIKASEDSGEWEQIATKSVEDSDGFLTDYTLWRNTRDGHFECIFGDNDLYTPENEYADAEFDDEASAREWFDNYHGFADED